MRVVYIFLAMACGVRAEAERMHYTVAQKEWGLAASAVLTYRNGDDFYSLTGCTESEKDIACQRSILSNSWGVESRQDLLNVLSRLKEKGHRGSMREVKRQMEDWPLWRVRLHYSFKDKRDLADERIAFIEEHAGMLDGKSLTGWDWMRVVSVVRWGVAAGYLSEDEAWDWIMPAAQTLQSTFDSWDDLGKDYLLGRKFWSKYQCWKNGYLYDEAVFWLASNPESPWRKLDWTLDLTGCPQPLADDSRLRKTACYFEALGLLGEKNYTEAIERFSLSMEEDPELYKGKACLKLGNIYQYGRTGISASPEKARSFYEKGAAYANEGCLLALGCNYYDGDGVQKDYAKALDFWEQAAAQGSPVALSNIGLLYSDGKGVEKDVRRALECEYRALKAGSTVADNNIAWFMYENPSLWNPDEAVRHAYEGVRKWEQEDYYDTLVKVLVKAERYPEARSALQRWIGFYQKKHNNFDDVSLPAKFKNMRRDIDKAGSEYQL